MNREEKIMRYITDDLNAYEKRMFEKEMDADEGRGSRGEANDVLKDIHEEFVNDLLVGQEKNKPLLRKMSGWFLLILASLIFLGYLLKGDKNQSQPIDNQQLFAQYFNHDNASFQVKSGNSETSKNIQEAEVYFNQKKYKESSEQFLLSEQELTADQRFYYGLALLGSGLMDEAIVQLDKVARADMVYVNECRWYKGLAYIKRGDFKKGKAEMEQIEESSSKYKVRSELLEAINLLQ